MGKVYGYMRVSTVDQSQDRQYAALTTWGVSKKYIFSDKLSGKDFNRPSYQMLRMKIKSGDVLVVKSIDRLGRNYDEILSEWRYLVKDKKINIVIIDMPLLDTRTNQDLIGTLISDIVLQLLSYVAQTEREFIRQRQSEGIALARLKGIHLGRKSNPIPPDFLKYYKLWKRKVINFKEFSTKIEVTENQLRWMVRKHQSNEQRPHK